jgi:uncharacterized membrane protein
MANCTNCGKPLGRGAKFCPSCGTAASGKSSKTGAQNQKVKASPKDVEDNKGMAIIAYLLFFVPLITGDHKKSPFVRFHTNQGTVLFLTAVALVIVRSIIWAIIRAIFFRDIYSVYSYSSWAGILGFVSTLSWLVGLAVTALCVIGIINAVNGNMKPLPLIGKFTIIK